MKMLARVIGYVAELKRVLWEVNRQVYVIDPIYVTYEWISRAVAGVQAVLPFLFAVIGIGYVIETPQPSWTVVLLGLLGLSLYLALRRIIFSWAQSRNRVFHSLLTNHLNTLRANHIAKLDVGRLVDPEFMQLDHMVQTRGISSIQSLWNGQKELVGAVVSFFVGAVALLALDWFIGLLAIFMALPSIVRQWMVEQKMRELDEAETIIHRKRNETYDAIASPKMTVLSRLLRLTGHFLSRYEELTGLLLANVRVIARFQRHWDIAIGLTALCCAIVFGLYFASGLVDGRYSLAGIGQIVVSFQLVAGAVTDFGWAIGTVEQERKDYQYLHRFFETPPLVDESACQPLVLPHTPLIVLQEVTFMYPKQAKPALHSCSVSFAPGDVAALVGPNGSGKTTLLRLVSRVYVPSQGRILVHGHSLDGVLQDSWLRHIVMVSQAASLPGMELACAITGSSQEGADMARLSKALEFSGADTIINNLPLGLKTWIGEEWPDGKGFSPGERRRFALAATFYRLLDPQVYVGLFDEPTADCDAQTKARFYQAIAQAPEFSGKTVLVSLHDPLYLHFFNRVLQFESGKLINDLRSVEGIEAYRNSIAMALAQDL